MSKNLFTITVIMVLITLSIVQATPKQETELPALQQGKNLNDCVKKLSKQDGGWCEIRVPGDKPSISSVWPDNLGRKTRMVVGPRSVLMAWNSAAFDEKRSLMYFLGGGHADYGGNEVYQFDLNMGKWTRLTDPSPLNYLSVHREYNKQKKTPWRRLCWIPNVATVPASTHTYDGLQFSTKTDTIFYYATTAATGSCIEDKTDDFKENPIVLGGHTSISRGWYEFNPSKTNTRNGLLPLTWRKVFDHEQLKSKSIHQAYPAAAELNDGSIVFGSSVRTVVYNPTIPEVKTLKRYSGQADWGDGTKIYDARRDLIWSIHSKALLAIDVKRGRSVQTIKTTGIGHGKSLALDKTGNLVSWNGGSRIFTLDPDEADSKWRLTDWKDNGPISVAGAWKVYGKWVYLKEQDVFAGLSNEKTGVWIYKRPQNIKQTLFSSINLQKIIKRAKPGSTVTIPPGIYSTGLLINKSLTVKLPEVELRGVAKRKGIINVSCNDCKVVIEDYHADGRSSGCLGGNCSGIKAEGVNFNLIVRRAHINNTVMGIITDNRGGSLTIEDSLIENTGLNDRSKTLGHAIYAGMIDKLVIRNSTIRRTFGKGHIVKSRAPDTQIENSIIAGIDGHQSRTVDFPCGGKLIIRNSTLQQSENADNTDLISVGTEIKACKNEIYPSEVSITNNWIIFDRDQSKDEPSYKDGPNVIFNWRAPVVSVDVSSNRIVESTGNLKFEYNGNVPDMSSRNEMFNSRKTAGLKTKEIPLAPVR